MNKKECRRIMREYDKKDIYTTHTRSVSSFNGFLSQCKRAINKLHGQKVSTKYDFWSIYAKEPAYKYFVEGRMSLSDEEYAKYEKAREMSYWEFLKTYGYLSVYDGIFCIDFDYDGIVFASYSSKALIEMGVLTKDEIDLYVECELTIN
jgi:hypothetical protein